MRDFIKLLEAVAKLINAIAHLINSMNYRPSWIGGYLLLRDCVAMFCLRLTFSPQA